jgi:hypothetical protein
VAQVSLLPLLAMFGAAAPLLGMANREDSRPGFFLLAQWVALGVLWLAGWRLVGAGEVVLGAITSTWATIVTFPWPIARMILIPAGRWRLAHALVRTSAWTWFDDNDGGAVIAAAWAASRRGSPGDAAAWIEGRFERAGRRGVAEIVASGLLADGRGDRDEARRMIASVVELDGRIPPRHARALAVEWCAAEAASRGRWDAVREICRATHTTRCARFVEAVAARLLGDPIDDRSLRWRWLIAPHRRANLPLLRRALRAEPPPVDEPDAPVVPTPGRPADPHRAALELHARVVAAARASRSDLDALVAAWERALLDPDVSHVVSLRARELGARVDAIARLGESVERDLVEIARRGRIAVGEPGGDVVSPLLLRVTRRLHNRLLDEIELAADALLVRVRAKRALPVHLEWRDWLQLRDRIEQAVALTGDDLRRLAFSAANESLCALAVWLWNDRQHKAHAHAMFCWLLREAEAVGDEAAIALHKRNVECGF